MFCEICGRFTPVRKFISPRSKEIDRLICVCPECFKKLNEQMDAIKILSEIFRGITSKIEDVKLFLSNNSLEFVKGYFTANLVNCLRNSKLSGNTKKTTIITLFQKYITPFLINIKNDIRNTSFNYIT